MSEEKKEPDIYRDTFVRYFGYANEVGEAFRALVHVNLVRFSYVVASSYVCADAYSKGKQASQRRWQDESIKNLRVANAVADTLVWQGLASVAIPGFTINRLCWICNGALQYTTKMPATIRKWTVTAIGLSSIPFIIKPIDGSVDWLMENTLRKWIGIDPVLEENIVHHTRNK